MKTPQALAEAWWHIGRREALVVHAAATAPGLVKPARAAEAVVRAQAARGWIAYWGAQS